MTDVTLSNCISAEALWYGEHVKGTGHTMGMLSGYGADRISIHHNFFTGNNSRNPLVSGAGVEPMLSQGYVVHPVFDLRDNVAYNLQLAHLQYPAAALSRHRAHLPYILTI